MFINNNEIQKYIANAIKTSVIEQLKQEGLINEREFYILKEQIK